MKLRIRIGLSALLVFLLALPLAGCDLFFTGSEGSPSDNASKPEEGEVTNAPGSGQTSDLNEFPVIPWQEGEMGAIAYMGYNTSILADNIMWEYNRYHEMYEYFNGGDIIIAETEGSEVYLIIPRWDDTKVTVHAYDNINDKVGELIYENSAIPFLLQCNMSDLHPNTLVTFHSAMGEFSFSPLISLVDGSIGLPEGGQICDVTLEAVALDSNLDSRLLGRWSMFRPVGEGQMREYVWDFSRSGIAEYFMYLDGEITDRYFGTYYISDGADGYPSGALVFDTTLERLEADGGELSTQVGDRFSGVYTIAYDSADQITLSYVDGSAVMYMQDFPQYYTYTYEKTNAMY